MRYKLIAEELDENRNKVASEVTDQLKKTKREIEQWAQDNIQTRGLDWRVGFMIKFRDSSTVYDWQWIKNNVPVSK